MYKIFSDIKDSCKKIKRHICRQIPDRKNVYENDIEGLINSSRLLHISEFKLFQIAYSRWYGRQISERGMEPIFSEYILEDRVPYWVRHLTRKIQHQYARGCFDPREYNREHNLSSYEWQGPLKFLPVFMIVAYTIFYLILTGQIRLP